MMISEAAGHKLYLLDAIRQKDFMRALSLWRSAIGDDSADHQLSKLANVLSDKYDQEHNDLPFDYRDDPERFKATMLEIADICEQHGV